MLYRELEPYKKAYAMRIKSIEANNFKSLVDFKIDLGPFNGLIGLNGSGKSTVLQFVDFASQLIKGNITEWLKERKWQPSDLKSKLTKKGNIDLKISFANKKGQEIGYWSANYNPSMKHCTQERIQFLQSSLEVKKGVVYITLRQNSNNESNSKIRIPFEYEGSILSALKEDLLPRSVLKCKSFLKNMNSLDLLSPEHLRQRTRESSGALGLGGQKLSSFLYELGRVKREDLTSRLRYVYPQLLSVGVKSLRSGWKQLEISEEYDGMEAGMRGFFPIMRTEARHVNDGMLRLITILAELQSKHSLLLFDEIENGINPEAVEFIIDTLTNSDKQVIVTTHSPMILNYLNDEIAKSGIVYLYKTSIGISKAIQFFTIPSIAEKLTVMGPGEVFVDTNLTELDKEIQTLDLKGE